MSGARERANGRASGPVLQSVFLAVIDHSERREKIGKTRGKWKETSRKKIREEMEEKLGKKKKERKNPVECGERERE